MNKLRNTLHSTITYTTYTFLLASVKLHIKKESHLKMYLVTLSATSEHIKFFSTFL